MSLLFRFSVFLHLLKHFFFCKARLTSCATWRVALMVVMLVICAVAEIRRVGFVGGHLVVLFVCPPMPQAQPAHN